MTDPRLQRMEESEGRERVRRRRHRPWYRRHTVRKRIYGALWAILALLVLLFAYQAMKATSALRLASTQAGVLQNQIAGGDVEAAQADPCGTAGLHLEGTLEHTTV